MGRDEGIANDFHMTSEGELICKKCGGSNWDGDVYESVGDDSIICIQCIHNEEENDE